MPLFAVTTTESLVAVWLFAMGGAIGSFLNVVVYRLPAGLSIDRPGSHCPACKHPIRWYDNVPILGWVILKGRCRDCNAPFSIRYPLVEASTAGLFLAVGLFEAISRAANLPQRPIVVDGGLLFADLNHVQLAILLAWHLILLCTLMAAALIHFDGHRIPLKFFAFAAVVGLLAPAKWPYLHPVPAVGGLTGVTAGAVDSLAGAAAAAVLGLALARLISPPHQRAGFVAASTCVGLYLGWQAAVASVIAAVSVDLILRPLRRVLTPLEKIPATAWLAVGTLAWLPCWRLLTERVSLLGYPSP